ncbi:MAG: cytochrome b/b6 domain-containing protein [Gaiella sp.]
MPEQADAVFVERFGRTERVLHWTHALGFLVMLATGLVLYVPVLAEAVARRELVKGLHLWTALVWAVALVAIVALGDRRRLSADWREVETIDSDDRRWLRGGSAPQGRFNAGQKLNVLATVAFAALFALSGLFLWLGERDHAFILDGAGTVHETLTLVSVALLVGHLYLAVVHPRTRHALRGITTGAVRRDWAAQHHAKWHEEDGPV